MSSGVAVDPACNEMWEDFHLGKVNKRRVITFRINDEFNSIIPDTDKWQLPLTKSGEDGIEETKEIIQQVKQLIADELGDDNVPNLPRWFIMYFDYKMESDGRLTGKELMVKWCPEQSKVKSKMTFASSAKGLNDSLNGFNSLVVQIDELEGIDDLLPKFQKGLLK
ncbi:hypothetical protein ACHWQZ_G014992 [Mnemiopsis leidyi]